MNLEKEKPGVGGRKNVNTICNMCTMCCGLNAIVEDGEILRVTPMKEHPHAELCPRAEGMIEWVYSKERILSPSRRTGKVWEEISWDEAFGFVSDKLIALRKEHGARSVVFHLGVPFIGTQTEKVIRRFGDLYGTPNYTSGSTYCFYARLLGHNLTAGHSCTHPDINCDTKCIIVWGNEPNESNHILAATISSAKARGVKLIMIDPRETPLAKQADIYAQIRPGTDCALALGLLNVIIEEGLYDKTFVDQWTVGFEKFVEHVKHYALKRVEEITWVPAETITKIARIYATSKPACIAQGIALDHCTNGVQTSRAISTLIAITGNFDVLGGNKYGTGLPQTNLRFAERVSMEDSVGADYPLFSKFVKESTAINVANQIISGKPYPIKALIIHGSNPALTWANSRKVKEAFERLELLVVIDLFMTETAKLAHVVLPATSFLERKTLKDYGGPYFPRIIMTDRAIEPLGKCMVDWQIWAELGKRIGYAEYFPWENDDQLFEFLIKNTGITMDLLRQNPGSYAYLPIDEQLRYLKRGFSTPSGKVEIYSETMEKMGYDPLPTFREPAESSVSRPDLAEKYPFILMTGPRVRMFTHSQHRNIRALRRYMPEPLVEINSETAKSLNIADGDVVIVESLRGSIKLKARVTPDIHPKVVSIQHGWSEANANILTDDDGRDPVSGYPGFKQVLSRLCRIEKA